MSFLPDDYKNPEENEDLLGIRTHSRYVVNISALLKSQNPCISLSRSTPYKQLGSEDKLCKKLEIVKYALESIKIEKKYSSQDGDFMPLALSWLWIKGYYIIFHLVSLLIALENEDSRYIFNKEYNGHSKIIIKFNEIMIANNFFNIGSLNRIYNGGALNSFTIKNHENIKRVEEFDINLYELLLKKIFKEESKARLRGLRGKKRTDLSQRIMTKQYGILDVFHYYRERFNYSGFHYLDADGQMLNQVELNRFYNASFEVIISVAKCFIEYLSLNTDSALKNKLDEIKI